MKRQTASKVFAAVLAVVITSGVTAGCGKKEVSESNSPAAGDDKKAAEDLLIGAAIYKFDDTFMAGMRAAMTDQAKKKKTGLELVDSQNRQEVQDEQIGIFITKGVNALIVSPVESKASGAVIEKAREKDLPLILLNCEEEMDLQGDDKVWCVGGKPGHSGTLLGEIAADFFQKHKEADKNGDGTIQYVMIQEEQNLPEDIICAESAGKALEDAGFQAEQIAVCSAMRERAKAAELMRTLMTEKGIENVEAVLCSNDDMALGAVEALQAEGYNNDPADLSNYIPVAGVGGTAPALEAVAEGSLSGTVLNDAANQGKVVINAAVTAARGEEINEENVGYPVTDGRYIWVDYVKITEENVKDYAK